MHARTDVIVGRFYSSSIEFSFDIHNEGIEKARRKSQDESWEVKKEVQANDAGSQIR